MVVVRLILCERNRRCLGEVEAGKESYALVLFGCAPTISELVFHAWLLSTQDYLLLQNNPPSRHDRAILRTQF